MLIFIIGFAQTALTAGARERLIAVKEAGAVVDFYSTPLLSPDLAAEAHAALVHLG